MDNKNVKEVPFTNYSATHPDQVIWSYVFLFPYLEAFRVFKPW